MNDKRQTNTFVVNMMGRKNFVMKDTEHLPVIVLVDINRTVEIGELFLQKLEI